MIPFRKEVTLGLMLTPVEDAYGRTIYNLRISVNQECNFSCFFCHEEGLWGQRPGDKTYLPPEEIQTTVNALTHFGIREIKITGGEPLLRKDIESIVKNLSVLNPIEDISMTTNGYYLEEHATHLKRAGLDRVNVSLNSLRPEVFAQITQTSRNHLQKVIAGIKEAKKVGLEPVKVNFVALKKVNIQEIPDIIEFAKENDLHLHLIEYHAPNEEEELYKRYFYPLDDLEDTLTSKAERVEIRTLQHRKKTILPDGTEAEFVMPMANPEFCKNCHRIRITADGKFKPCLMRNDNHVDFTSAFHSENPEEAIVESYTRALKLREPYFCQTEG